MLKKPPLSGEDIYERVKAPDKLYRNGGLSEVTDTQKTQELLDHLLTEAVFG